MSGATSLAYSTDLYPWLSVWTTSGRTCSTSWAMTPIWGPVPWGGVGPVEGDAAKLGNQFQSVADGFDVFFPAGIRGVVVCVGQDVTGDMEFFLRRTGADAYVAVIAYQHSHCRNIITVGHTVLGIKSYSASPRRIAFMVSEPLIRQHCIYCQDFFGNHSIQYPRHNFPYDR